MARNIDISKFKKEAQKEVEQKGKGGQSYLNLPEGVDLVTLGDAKKGEDRVAKAFDFLLYEQKKHITNESKADYKLSYKLHTGLGVDGKTKVVCPTTFGKPCPICEMRKELGKEYDNMTESERKVYSSLKPSERSIYNIMEDGKVKLFEMSDFCFQSKLEEELKSSEDDVVYLFPDDDEGFTVNARFTKNDKKNFTFYECSRIDFKDRKPIPEKVLNQIVNLEEVLEIKSYEELEDLLNGTNTHPKEDIEVEKDEPTVSSRRRGRTEEPKKEDKEEEFKPRERVRRKEVEEEDGDVASFGDDVEEEEEQPRRPRRKSFNDDVDDSIPF